MFVRSKKRTRKDSESSRVILLRLDALAHPPRPLTTQSDHNNTKNIKMISPTCNVCKNDSESERYISICLGCLDYGYDLNVHQDAFLPYYEMTSEASPEPRYRTEPLAFKLGVRHGKLERRYYNKTPKESTMVKKELTLGKTHKVDIGVLLAEKKDMREYIIGDYLKMPRSKTSADHVKRAFALKEIAKKILPSDPVQALCYLQKRPELGKRGKKVDVEKLRIDFFDNVDLFASVRRFVGSVIAAFAGVTTKERCGYKLGSNSSRYFIGDKIPLLKPHEDMLKKTPVVLLKAALSDNGIAKDNMDEFLGRDYFQQFMHEFTVHSDVNVSSKYETIAKEMVHFSRTVSDVHARQAYFNDRYNMGHWYNGNMMHTYVSGEQFLGKTGLHMTHLEGTSDLAAMWDC